MKTRISVIITSRHRKLNPLDYSQLRQNSDVEMKWKKRSINDLHWKRKIKDTERQTKTARILFLKSTSLFKSLMVLNFVLFCPATQIQLVFHLSCRKWLWGPQKKKKKDRTTECKDSRKCHVIPATFYVRFNVFSRSSTTSHENMNSKQAST